jgi:hypothetical protein
VGWMRGSKEAEFDADWMFLGKEDNCRFGCFVGGTVTMFLSVFTQTMK